jgi:hypothetical protein
MESFMPSTISGVTGSLPWGQEKKTETGTTTGGTTSPTTAEPTTTEPTTTGGATEPVSSAKTYSAPEGNQVTEMPDRLRDLIVAQSTQNAPAATPLFGVVLRMPDASSTAPLSSEQVVRTRAQIIAQASVSMVAQANHTGDSVRALLGAAA